MAPNKLLGKDDELDYIQLYNVKPTLFHFYVGKYEFEPRCCEGDSLCSKSDRCSPYWTLFEPAWVGRGSDVTKCRGHVQLNSCML